MKTRVITGVSGALIAIAAIVFMQYPCVIGLPLAFFSALSVHEIMHIIGCKNKVLTVIGMVFAGAVPPVFDVHNYLKYEKGYAFFDSFHIPLWAVLAVYAVLVMVIMLRTYSKTKFEEAAMLLFSSVWCGFGYASLIWVRDIDHFYPEYFQQSQGFFIALVTLFCAWISDTFAYFFGRKFGKHKLAPVISPKKSVEGAVAGVLGTELISVIAYFVAKPYFDRFPDSLPLWVIIIGVAVAVILGMCGDLSASVIKRNFGAKDYGTFFPGHGGAMDRFDSYLFAMPSVAVMIALVMGIIA